MITDIIRGRSGTGVEVGGRFLRAASVRRSSGAFRMGWSASAPLPEGLIKDSFTEPNITDMAAFVALLKGLVKGRGPGAGRVGVALPDYISRVTTLEFDVPPGKKEETERMIRWRLKKQIPFDIDQAELRTQYLGSIGSKDGGQHRFLTAIIKSDVLAQYSRAFSEAGLRPEMMEISSFAVWNLYHDLVLKEAGERTNFALMCMFGGKMTVMVFDRGAPHFLRLKDLIRQEQAEDGGVDVTRVLRELTASLTYYRENYTETPVTRVFVAGDFAGLGAIAREVKERLGLESGALDFGRVVRPGPGAGGAEDMQAYSAACGAAMEL